MILDGNSQTCSQASGEKLTTKLNSLFLLEDDRRRTWNCSTYSIDEKPLSEIANYSKQIKSKKKWNFN